MKKILLLLLTLTTCAFIGCGVSSSDYENLQSQLNNLQAEYDKLVAEKEVLQTDLEELKSQNKVSNDEYAQYKEKMKPYEDLQESEVEARKIEAEKMIAEKEAELKAQEAALAEEKAQKEAAGYDTGITYDKIARNPDDYIGEKVKFTGKVIQLIEGSGTIQIRFAIDKNYDKVVLCEYDSSIVKSRILEDDVITIYGISYGTISYQSTMGGQITIPSILVDRIDQ